MSAPCVLIFRYHLLSTLRLSALVLALQARWALYSRRKDEPLQLKPVQIPLLVSLGHYATERSKVPDLSLRAFLEQELAKFPIPGLPQFIIDQLKAGNCLILLDGLDEVSDQQMRQQVQAAIRTFLLENRDPIEKTSAFNRCLVTSRVAGYDQAAFPGVPHFTIAELTDSQVERFLPRWYQANLRQAREGRTRLHADQQHTLVRDANTLASRLSSAIQEHQGLRDLAENPLLLTLLAVMQQNSIELPRQRVELYQTVTKTLLENRNLARNLPTIPEAQALQRLGPLAFWLQEHSNSFARRSDIETMLRAAIAQDGGSAEEIEAELAIFLARIRERTGLFLQRTADYFGFYHRTFQEYFAARYLLARLGRGSPEEIADLVQRARHPNDLWREPFLLAVAYKSGEDQQLASEVIRTLLTSGPDAEKARQQHDLLLAAECVVEAKPLTIDPTLQSEIVERLLELYKEALQSSTLFEVCDQIEAIMRRWLLSVPSTAYRPPIVTCFAGSLRDAAHPSRQRVILTLLLMIARRLRNAPDNVLTPLSAILLDLVGLTAQGKPKSPRTHLSSSDMLLADLALVVLSFLETRGPAGTLLPELRRSFNLHPEHLRSLASHSLERQTLLTPVVIPLEAESYQRYQSVIAQWQRLQSQLEKHAPSAKDFNICLSIQQTLLACAEEIRYPSTYHLLNLVQAEERHPEQPWQQSWQGYLVTQLESGHYISYQDVALLWLILFPEEEAMKNLFKMIETHYRGGKTPQQSYAQWFLARVSSYERHQLDEREQRFIYSKYMAARNSWLLPDLRMMRDLRDLLDLCRLHEPADMRKIHDSRLISDPVFLQRLNPKSVYINLSVLLPTHSIAEQTIKCLAGWAATPSADPQEGVDLLTILLGRMLRLLKTGEMGDVVEQEIEQLCQVITSHRQSLEVPQVRDALKELICYLPARTAQEITLLVQLAEDASKGGIVNACAIALDRTAPKTPEAWQSLESVLNSPVEDIRTMVEKRLQKLQQEASTGPSK